eukprot:scaffold119235_cov27-Phaeocystis_antarctica.AAC.2
MGLNELERCKCRVCLPSQRNLGKYCMSSHTCVLRYSKKGKNALFGSGLTSHWVGPTESWGQVNATRDLQLLKSITGYPWHQTGAGQLAVAKNRGRKG